jgi:transcriptional regulator with XRE-family HTH domain
MRNFIRQARQRRGLTQAELAELVGTTAATVSRLEKNTMTVSTEWLSRFAEALGVHASDLLERPGRPPVELLGRVGRAGRIIFNGQDEISLDLSTTDPVAVELTLAQGPYLAGERLVGERLRGASTVSGVGRDCIVALKDGGHLLARVVGTPPRFILVPPEPGSPILYDQEVEWLAPLVIRILPTEK